MNRLIILILMLTVSTAISAEKRSIKAESLESKWAKDESLLRFNSTDKFTVYGIKGTMVNEPNNKNIVNIWVSLLYTPKGRKIVKTEAKGIYYSKQKWSFNCVEKKYTIQSIVYYDAKGSTLASKTQIDDKWDDVVPNSVSDYTLKAICETMNNVNAESESK